MIIVALTSEVSRPLSIMNYESKITKCNVSLHGYENCKHTAVSMVGIGAPKVSMRVGSKSMRKPEVPSDGGAPGKPPKFAMGSGSARRGLFFGKLFGTVGW